jgi:hypothetical protein
MWLTKMILNFKNIVFLIFSILFIFTIMDQKILAESTQTLVVNTDDKRSFRSQIAVDENTVYLVWTESDIIANDEVYFSKSTDGGNSFDTPIDLSKNSGISAFPRIALSGNDVYVVWYDYTIGKSEIFIAKSSDGGKTFDVKNLSNNVGPSFNPWIGVSGDDVFVVWTDGTRDLVRVFGDKAEEIDLSGKDVSFGLQDILFASSQDGGENFAVFSLSDPSVESWNQRMLVHDDKVYVVWNGRSDDTVDIYLSVSKDGGISFSEPANVSRSQNTSFDAGLAAWENNLYIIWQENDSETTDIFYSKTTDDGLGFSAPISIGKNLNSAITRDSEISAINDNVYVVWYEDASEGDVYFVKSSDKGDSFGAPISLDMSKGKSKFPQLAAYEDQVYVIWGNNGTGNSDVFFRASYDEGSTFGSIRNISNDENDSHIIVLGPQIAANENAVFTVFENQTAYEASNLHLDKFIPDITPPGKLILHLDNNKANVEVNFDPAQIQTEQDTLLSLRFYDSKSGNTVSDVNYSIMIKDSDGKTVLEKLSQHAIDGTDFHNATFSKEGPATALIEIEGTGTELPYDSMYSGITGFVVTAETGLVDEETEYGMFLILGLVIVLVILISYTKIKKSKSN